MEGKRLVKRQHAECVVVDDEVEKVYKFKILLPNGASVSMTLHDPGNEMCIEEFVEKLKHKYFKSVKPEIVKQRRRILWRSKEIYLQDINGTKIIKKIVFGSFQPYKCHLLTLHDGAEETADTFQNMWDLTPDTGMLTELPEEYTFETALGDLIDNSLQAVWANAPGERRLVSVASGEHSISVFDTGPGMDSNDENSIVKWGKIGASLHRSSRGQAIGGKPPYLKPFFGMFGYGGAIASMHLGKHALVSSKTKRSKKVYTLHLKREALLENSGEKAWKTDGGIRDPSEDEIHRSPHGSFTKVEIFEPKLRLLDSHQLRCKLKDIYFPYIQCDEFLTTGKTIRLVEFQVNDDDLAEVQGGEVAITNLLSCNGPEFVLQLHFSVNQDITTPKTFGKCSKIEANARLRCVYFPIVEGKENIDRILEKLEGEGLGTTENFNTFSRVSIRRLGRLLPDARWGRLPFMEPKPKRGLKAQVLKRCLLRVKCFIETDAGFIPTHSKTDLALHHPFTSVLKNFGNKPSEKESDVIVKIHRDGKPLRLSQLEKEYDKWIFQMHDGYDEEVVCGEDEPVLVVSPRNKEGLGISTDVVRVHKVIRRKGASWQSGQNIKILKGAVGCHKNNLYATLEYILLEGFQGDVCGEARLICRPLSVPEENGCSLKLNGDNASLDICCSLSFPISIIDSGKCQAMESSEWNYQLEMLHQKAPSTIDILNNQQCEQLELEDALPINAPVYAGRDVPKEIVAVIRPASFSSSRDSESLDQKFIVKDDLEMYMEITYIAEDRNCQEKHIFGGRIKPSSHMGFYGLYIFSLRLKFPELFMRTGIYKFCFAANCTNSSAIKSEYRVKVMPSIVVGKWEALCDKQSPPYHVRVGSCFPHLSIACFDVYDNRMQFLCLPELDVKLDAKGDIVVNIEKMRVDVSSNKMNLEISDILIKSSDLDQIRPNYEATLEIHQKNKMFGVTIPCLVIPGHPKNVKAPFLELEKPLLPGDVIAVLLLEMTDAYGNHVEKGLEVLLSLDGFRFQNFEGLKLKADDNGCIDLSGNLEVVGSYGKIVSLSVNYDGKTLFKKEFQVEKRTLTLVSKVPNYCAAGSKLDNIEFEVVNSEGVVDETIHEDMKLGRYHTLEIKSESSAMNDTFRIPFCKGRCLVPHISIPLEQGIFSFIAAHSRHPDLNLNVKVHVIPAANSKMFSLHENEVPVHSQHCNVQRLQLQESPICFSKNMQAFLESIMNDVKAHENNVFAVGVLIGDHEKQLTVLDDKKKGLEQEIYDLQASIGPESQCQLDCLDNEKEVVLRQIEEKVDTAASVFCDIEKTVRAQELQNLFKQDIVGLVALLGAVNSSSLSRIFAEYLGEENMLAVVCKSYAIASALESYEKSGRVDREVALHAVAAEFGKSINRRFLVICLEDISPYDGELEHDNSQQKLALPPPVLPNGVTPHGFLGFAVNMINLDIHHLYTRTSRGHGLRETLFYLLFGKLQVYETRNQMRQAHPCIKEHGAVSLDGGIMKGNGLMSLGHCEPKVLFPVVTSEVQPQTTEILQKLSEKRLEVEAISDQMKKLLKSRAKAMKQYRKERELYIKYLNEKEPLLSGRYLDFKDVNTTR